MNAILKQLGIETEISMHGLLNADVIRPWRRYGRNFWVERKDYVMLKYRDLVDATSNTE